MRRGDRKRKQIKTILVIFFDDNVTSTNKHKYSETEPNNASVFQFIVASHEEVTKNIKDITSKYNFKPGKDKAVIYLDNTNLGKYKEKIPRFVQIINI